MYGKTIINIIGKIPFLRSCFEGIYHFDQLPKVNTKHSTTHIR